MDNLILDGHKLPWHMDRVRAWERGERIAPVTIDMALTRACNYACQYCYAQLQENQRMSITEDVMAGFLDDCAEIGVRGISLVSDGESTLSPAFDSTVLGAAQRGLSVAVGTNAYLFPRRRASVLLPALDYIRVNMSAGLPARYSEVMGVPETYFHAVVANIRGMVEEKRSRGLGVTIGLQMVLMPELADQILPFAQLAVDLGVDYAIIKHCSDDEYGALGVDYGQYPELKTALLHAISLSGPVTGIFVKWSKIEHTNRMYRRCYGPPFIIQMSGSGLVAPCGFLFNERYKKFHIGNICDQRFKAIWESDRYWEVMEYLASAEYDARRMCGSLCLQHSVNTALDRHRRGEKLQEATGERPQHVNFL